MLFCCSRRADLFQEICTKLLVAWGLRELLAEKSILVLMGFLKGSGFKSLDGWECGICGRRVGGRTWLPRLWRKMDGQCACDRNNDRRFMLSTYLRMSGSCETRRRLGTINLR